MINYNIINYIFPRTIAERGVLAYVAALTLVTLLFFNQSLPWWLLVWGLISVVLFFNGSAYCSKRWSMVKPMKFEQKVLVLAILIRIVYVIFIYYFNQYQYDSWGESNHDDADWYVPTGVEIADGWRNGTNVIKGLLDFGIDVSDMGYVIYLAVINFVLLGASDVFIPLILKAFLGAYTCIFMYRLATRHFGEHVGRMTAIFCLFNPNMIWWCGSMMKETEMIFLSTMFVNYADAWLQESKLNTKNIVLTVLSGMAMFTVRTALAAVQVASIAFAVLFSKTRVISTSRKIWVMVLLTISLLIGMGGTIWQDLHEMYDTAKSGEKREARYDNRANRGGTDANTFARYATATVFAPLIFTIPFPSMVYTNQSQEMQMMVNGGNYIKNIMSYFVIVVMFIFMLTGKWRQHAFPLAVLLGYLVALVFSDFAHSGRFHMPAIPYELLFAAYGISIMRTKSIYQRWFMYALVIEVVACVGWNFIKLRGRGLA